MARMVENHNDRILKNSMVENNNEWLCQIVWQRIIMHTYANSQIVWQRILIMNAYAKKYGREY